MVRRWLRPSLALALSVGTVVGCTQPRTPEVVHAGAPPTRSAQAQEEPSARAEADACAACHAEIVASWARSGMGRSVSAIDPAEFQGLESVSDEPSGYRYHFETDTAGTRVVETRPDAPDHRLEADIAYAIGADDIRSYVARRGAFSFFAPIEIVAATHKAERHAALAPGHMAAPNQRFSVAITPECLGCHTDQLPPPVFPRHLDQTESWEPRGMSCAACHGPVDQHAAWRVADEAGDAPTHPDPVVRPQDLSRERRMSVCSACHLQGDALLHLTDDVGPPEPGGDLLERRAIFVPANPTNDIGFVSHTERLVLSRCYQESETLWCGSCHDPHRPLDEQRGRVRSTCLSCHAEGGSAAMHACSRPNPEAAVDDDCVSCHMRETPVFDVASVEIHDHFIRKDPGPPSERVPIRFVASKTGDWKAFSWPSLPAPVHAADPGLWMMAYGFRGHVELALAKAFEEPGPVAERFPMYHHARGSLFERAGLVDQAQRSYQWALMLDPNLTAASINAALLRGLGGQVDRGIQLLDQVLERHPEAVNALRNRAGLRIQKEDAAGFVADLTRAFELSPNAVVADILAEWYRENGDVETASTWSREAKRLDPVAFR